MTLCRKHFLSVLLVGLVVVGCGVRIETGRTQEEAVASSESRARGIRSSWARRVDRAGLEEVAYLLQEYINSTAASLMKYGWRLEEKWQEGNTGRGEAILDTEMRKIIEAWTSGERPVLMAWEDNIEYAWGLIREKGHLDDRRLGAVREMVDQYYRVYSGIMFPSGTVDDYRNQLRTLESETESTSRMLSRELE